MSRSNNNEIPEDPTDPYQDEFQYLWKTIPALNTCKQTAELLHVHVRTIRRWLEEGKLRAYRPGGRKLLITRDSIVRRLQESQVVHY